MPKGPGHKYNGEPCSRCGATLKYETTRSCVACAKAAVRRARNPAEPKMIDDLIGNLANYLPKEPES